MNHENFERIGRFYGALQAALGHGNLWMCVELDSVRFDWYPNEWVKVRVDVSLLAIDNAVSLEAIAKVEAHAMLEKHRAFKMPNRSDE